MVTSFFCLFGQVSFSTSLVDYVPHISQSLGIYMVRKLAESDIHISARNGDGFMLWSTPVNFFMDWCRAQFVLLHTLVHQPKLNTAPNTFKYSSKYLCRATRQSLKGTNNWRTTNSVSCKDWYVYDLYNSLLIGHVTSQAGSVFF